MTLLSLAEVEAIAIKAARGAGYDWGLAEEAAFATRWLVEQGIDGPAALATLLDGPPKAGIVMAGQTWSAINGQRLCPIAVGAAVSDHFDLPEGPGSRLLRLTNVAHPVFLLPFLAAAAARAGVVLVVEWGDTRVILSDRRILAVAGAQGLLADLAPVVSLSGTPNRPQTTLQPPRAEVSVATVQKLNQLAMRTYVPASDQSRRGAGAAGTDAL